MRTVLKNVHLEGNSKVRHINQSTALVIDTSCIPESMYEGVHVLNADGDTVGQIRNVRREASGLWGDIELDEGVSV